MLRILWDYPWALCHAWSDEEVKDRAEHRHYPHKGKDEDPVEWVRVDLATCLCDNSQSIAGPQGHLVEGIDQPVFWLLNVLQVKLRVDDLVPDKGDPGTGDEGQEEGVGDHVGDPQVHVGSGSVCARYHLKVTPCVVRCEEEDDAHTIQYYKAGKYVPDTHSKYIYSQIKEITT